jgi:Na+-transporting NADH:ubiquinone oxidoreductase subunit F
MEGTSLILLGVVLFTVIVLALVVVILLAKSKLVTSGEATVIINDDPEKAVKIPIGSKLLFGLADQQVFIPSACGGQGIIQRIFQCNYP